MDIDLDGFVHVYDRTDTVVRPGDVTQFVPLGQEETPYGTCLDVTGVFREPAARRCRVPSRIDLPKHADVRQTRPMAEERPADPESLVFCQDPARYRRARRTELVAGGLVCAVVPAALCLLPSPWWLLGLAGLVVLLVAFVVMARPRWNARPPMLSLDATGITYRDRHPDIAVRNSNGYAERYLAWSEVERVEIAEGGRERGGLTLVKVRPVQPDASAAFTFQPSEVGATETEVIAAVARFAPAQASSVVDNRRPPARWAAPAGILLVLLLSALFTWRSATGAVAGYRAAHHGVSGTALVTHVDWGRGQSAGGRSVTGDFTPSSGGPVRRGVTIVTGEAVYVGETIRVTADRSDPASVYTPGSRGWIGWIAGAAVSGLIGLAALSALCVTGIRALLRTSNVEGRPGGERRMWRRTRHAFLDR